MDRLSRSGRARARLAALGLGAALAFPLGAAPAAAAGTLFQPATDLFLPSGADAVAVADVTGDGRDDVVVTTGYDDDPANDFQLLVLAQGPDGLLGDPVAYDTAGTYPERPGSVDVGDVNGDGRPDVVVGLDRHGIQVFHGQPDGTLGAPTFTAHEDSTRVRVGQLDKDGRADVAGIGWGSDTVTVFSDTGAGLAASGTYPVHHDGWDDLELGDVNGDGNQDLVVMSGQGLGTSLHVVPGLSNGTFGAAIPYPVYDQQVNANGVGVGDTNGDGRDDIVLSYGGNQPSSRVALWVQLADGTLDMPVIHGSYDIPGALEVADLDRDGNEDVVAVHDGWARAGVYLGRNEGVLDAEDLYPIPTSGFTSVHGLALGDLNGDGWQDVVVAEDDGLIFLSNSQVFQPTEPDPPILNAALPGNGQVMLVWQRPENDGGADITLYTATASPGGQYCTGTGSVCTITGLENGTTYSFTVQAGNAVGNSAPSNALSAMPGVAPTVPRSLAVEPNLPGGIGLTWQAPTSLGEPTSFGTGYRIYRSVNGSTATLLTQVNVQATSFTDSSALNGGTYGYQIAAFNPFGEGPRTALVTVQRGTAPAAPRTLTASVAAKAITLAWQAPASNGGATVMSYRIYRGTSSATKTLLASVNGTTLTYQDKALTKRTKYFYWVTAVNVLGEGVPSNEVSATSR